MSSSPPPTTLTPPIPEEIPRERAAAARQKKDSGGAARSARRGSTRSSRGDLTRLQDPSSFDDLVVACYRADIVYIGDYHALPASQEFAARLLREITARSGEVVLCMEMVYTRSQKILDRFMAGEVGAAQILNGIRHCLDMGCDCTRLTA